MSEPVGTPPGRAGRLARAYRTAAVLALNTALLFALVNLGAWVALALLTPEPGPTRYGMERLRRVYPGWSDREIRELLAETWSRTYLYRPFVQHREGPFTGRYVNVSRHGFRHVADQSPWPPAEDELVVFFLGGSTTYGYGVPDGSTIPSVAQDLLRERCARRVSVFNFGGGNFYSEQERALLSQHLAAGVTPDLAVFVDGLNEWKTAPKFTARLEYLMTEDEPRLWLRALKSLPLADLARLGRDRLLASEVDPEGAPPDVAAERFAADVVDRWLRHQRAVAALARDFGFEVVFVWQPTPAWGYDLESHPFLDESREVFAGHEALRHGYDLMELRRHALPQLSAEAGFLWLADLQRGRTEPLYVDAAHYSEAFSREIAARVAGFVAPRLGCDAGM
ncbi:MAG: SGNH/GDSL hydrolase family protein [Thermoanaerobaculia bacterium]|nr:SGNH/GDSL hydrolase family protein [Thermoanaerobaculia bacterium]